MCDHYHVKKLSPSAAHLPILSPSLPACLSLHGFIGSGCFIYIEPHVIWTGSFHWCNTLKFPTQHSVCWPVWLGNVPPNDGLHFMCSVGCWGVSAFYLLGVMLRCRAYSSFVWIGLDFFSVCLPRSQIANHLLAQHGYTVWRSHQQSRRFCFLPLFHHLADCWPVLLM